MIPVGFFVPASVPESLAALVFNAFVTIFLLPIVVMDLCYFFPLAAVHVVTGKATLRIIPVVLSGAALWLGVLGIALMVLHLVNTYAVALLFRTWSGLLGALVGTLHTALSLFRYRKNMREHYYAQMLEKNLSPRQAGKNAALRLALQSGELDPIALQHDHSTDYLSQRIVRRVLASRQGIDGIMSDPLRNAEVYFL